MAEPIKCRLGCGLGWAQGSMCMAYGRPDPPREGAMLGERTCHGVPDDTVVSRAKLAQSIELRI